MTAGFGKTYVSAIMMYFVFAFWAVLTLSILCLMEGLSAFLHTLRKFISVSVHTYLILCGISFILSYLPINDCSLKPTL